jgi:hypothetical protein
VDGSGTWDLNRTIYLHLHTTVYKASTHAIGRIWFLSVSTLRQKLIQLSIEQPQLPFAMFYGDCYILYHIGVF